MEYKDVKVRVNFGERTGLDLIKTKFGFFNSGYVPVDRWLRDVDLLEPLRPPSVRYEIGWGMGNGAGGLFGNKAYPQEWDAPAVRGTADSFTICTGEIDRFVDSLNQRGILPFLICCYTPQVLQPDGGDYTSVPSDITKWRVVTEAFARHFAESRRKVGYYELWNEPDLDVFFRGSKEQFFEIYRQGVLGIRAGDPAAKVGGPALSVHLAWAADFVSFVKEEKLPLDFLSFHMFGNRQSHFLDVYRGLLRDSYFEETKLILSEYNPLSAQTHGSDFCDGGEIETHRMAPKVLHAMKYFLAYPELTQVHWAQFNDPEVYGPTADRCGVISTLGQKKAAYHAFYLYARMPVKGCRLTVDDESVEGLSAAEDGKAGILLWNNSPQEKWITISLKGAEAVSGWQLYRIDREHGRFAGGRGEELEPQVQNCGPGKWEGTLPGEGVICLLSERKEEENGESDR